ncbi:MAG TPA: 4-alpha-glucanotransferase [Planctomycetota bacterium]|jgi:4-alpha-glucanotransferase
MKRASGVLLHITNLPSEQGIGDLGQWAYAWVDFLAAAKQQYWQILPLGPTGYGDSPYSSFSAFAGNPLLISLDRLVADELLKPSDIEKYDGPPHKVLFERIKEYKHAHLQKAYKNFLRGSPLRGEFENFCSSNAWLEHYALFMAKRDSGDSCFPRFEQFLFFRQFQPLKAYANKKGIQIVGDMPMYVASDSVDKEEWPDLFDQERGFSAGTPPSDIFPQGQSWGNPLYRWDKHRETGYRWWIDRARWLLTLVDIVRLDYFGGYMRYWANNGGKGHWRNGPAYDLFEKTRQALGGLPFIAEDLGEWTPELRDFRNRFNFPGMKILQNAFDGSRENQYLPENFDSTNCVVYTGTHDNDTTKGWYQHASFNVQQRVRDYVKADGRDVSWDLLKVATRSKADLMIIPYQDVLCLGSEARSNTPGTVSANNWAWRMQPQMVTAKIADSLGWLTREGHRG